MTEKKRSHSQYSPQTKLMYGEWPSERWDYNHHVVPPLTTSSTFRLTSTDRGAQGFAEIGQQPADLPIYVYDRMGEPTADMLQDALASAEGGEIGVVFATGMAAISAAVLFTLFPGAEVISHRTIYGCTFSLFSNWLPKMGYKAHFTNLNDTAELKTLINDNTRIVYLESPANPTLELLDTPAIVAVVNEANKARPKDRQILTIFDNTFASPFSQRPLSHGIDIVVHSLTKAICGFGTEMGGGVITRKEFFTPLILFRKDFGGTLSPSPAWHLLVYGLPTLALRLRYQQENAAKIADYLETHPLVDRVYFPGLPSFPQYELAQKLLRDFDDQFAPGMMLFFVLKGRDPEHARRRGERMMNFIADEAYAITLAVSLGQIRTLIEHPGSMTHAAYSAEKQLKIGIDPGGIRLAVGAEGIKDLIHDLTRALDVVENVE